MGPKVVLAAGGGGVGKTSSSAALGVATARRGERTLLVTIDPARRLADAFGVSIGDKPQPMDVPGTEGRLLALMPDQNGSARAFLQELFGKNSPALVRMENNRLFKALSDSLAGMHELVCMSIVAEVAPRLEVDRVIIDTAPSRHAVDFLAYPGRFASLFDGRAIGFLAKLNQGGGGLDFARKGVEMTLAKVLGESLVRDVGDLFTELLGVSGRFVSITKAAESLLFGPHARYVLVAAPSGGAVADAIYLKSRLEVMQVSPHAVLLNRADATARPWMVTLLGERDLSPALRDSLLMLEDERATRSEAADRAFDELARSFSKHTIIRVPNVEAATPRDVVLGLADDLAPRLDKIIGS